MAGRLHDLARARPRCVNATADALTIGLPREVVVQTRIEVVAALNALEDVAIQDRVDAVRRMKAERRDRVVVDLLLVLPGHQVARAVWIEGIGITRGPTRLEVQAQPVFHQLLLQLEGKSPLAQLAPAL